MKPLWFLFTRQLLNSSRRAFANPLRAILAIILITIVASSLIGLQYSDVPQNKTQVNQIIQTDPLAKMILILTFIHAVYFLLMFISLTANKSIFNESDMNFVFPVSLPKLKVFYLFLFRNVFFGSLYGFLTILFYTFIISPRIIFKISSLSQQAPLWATFSYPVLFFLVMFTLSVFHVIWGIKVMQSKLTWKQLRHLFIIIVVLILLSITYYTTDAIRDGQVIRQAIYSSLHQPVIFWALLPVRAFAEALLVPYTGWSLTLTYGLLLWFTAATFTFQLLKKNKAWLYEYGSWVAQRQSIVRAQQKNPILAIKNILEKKRQKTNYGFKQIRLAKLWSPSGELALLWRNLIVDQRVNENFIFKSVIFVTIGMVVFNQVSGYVHLKITENLIIVILAIVFGAISFIYLLGSYYVIPNLSKNTDIQKPLPFRVKRVILIEIMYNIIVVALSNLLIFIAALFLFDTHWIKIIYVFVVGVSVTFPLSVGLNLLLLINPEKSDPLQRIIVVFFQLPVLLLCLLPSAAAITVGFILNFSLFLNAFLTISVNAIGTFLLVILTAKKYEHFNPSE